MPMSPQGIERRWSLGALGLALAVLATGCGERTEPAAPDPATNQALQAAVQGADGANATVRQELAELRRTTARLHRFEDAEDEYTVLVRHPTTGAACLDHPTDGAMGRHYLNTDLVNDEVSITEPEVVIYEPQSNGRLRLVGLEYIIPFAIRGPDETPPVLFGQEFLHNTTFDLWMLHVYAWKNNPSGIFATWNPTITCEHDDAVD